MKVPHVARDNNYYAVHRSAAVVLLEQHSHNAPSKAPKRYLHPSFSTRTYGTDVGAGVRVVVAVEREARLVRGYLAAQTPNCAILRLAKLDRFLLKIQFLLLRVSMQHLSYTAQEHSIPAAPMTWSSRSPSAHRQQHVPSGTRRNARTLASCRNLPPWLPETM